MYKINYALICCAPFMINAAFAVTPLCTSDKFCVNSKMPLLSQSSPSLPPLIAKYSNNSAVKQDRGWCAAVASTMTLAGARLSSQVGTYPSDIENVKYIATNSDLNLRTAAYASTIYKVGKKIGTSWVNGGTPTHSMMSGVSNYLNGVGINPITQEKAFGKGLGTSAPNFKLLFKNQRWNFQFVVCARDTSSYTSYLIRDCHIISFNGYEGNSLKIFDPWGRIYNVNIQASSTVKNYYVQTSKFPVLTFSQGIAGYVNNQSARTVTLQDYFWFYVRNK